MYLCLLMFVIVYVVYVMSDLYNILFLNIRRNLVFDC